MNELDRLLDAFDAELAQLCSEKEGPSPHFVAVKAKKLRAALRDFYVKHNRLPADLEELFDSGFSVPQFQQLLLDWIYPAQMNPNGCGIQPFLKETQHEVDLQRAASKGTWFTLRLVHAVYRAHDPVSKWQKSAAVLARRGFTAEQIRLAMRDREVRTAFRKLARPYDTMS